MVVLIPSARIVSVFSTLRGVRLPAQGLDFVLVDKDCECIVSTRSVRIALILSSSADEIIFTYDGFKL